MLPFSTTLYGLMPALHDPPGAGCDEGDPTKARYPGKARGGPGGRNAGTRGAEESEHARHTTRAHYGLTARYKGA